MTKRKNKMLRMWVLYGLLVGVALFCAGLIFCNVASNNDIHHLNDLARQLQQDQRHSLIITDLVRSGNPFDYDTPIPAEGSSTLKARTNSFDLLISTADTSLVESPLMGWAMALQDVALVCMCAIVGLIVALLVNMFRSLRQGRLFRRSGMRLLAVIGLLVILLTLSLDTATYLERLLAFRLLEGSGWEPLHGFQLHATRLFAGLIILFTAEILRIGHTLQEEQDLTI